MTATVERRALEIVVRDLKTNQDLRSVMAIEEASFVTPWTEDDFKRVLKAKAKCVVLAESARKVIGYMALEVLPKSFCVLSMAVHPDYRRKGVGTRLLGWLCDQLKLMSKGKVAIEVRETNLGMQLFLRNCRFHATEVLRDYYEDTGEDGYRFERLAIIEDV
jgi:ribosomal-protein-alanine N-acetyltransferase